MKDYYQILGVSPDATSDDIKKAYRKLATFWHPDKNDSIEAKSRFQEINEAYQTLHDKGKREEYDYSRNNQPAFTFDWLNRMKERAVYSYTHKVRITIEQAYTGTSISLGRGLIAVIPPGTVHNTVITINPSNHAIVHIMPSTKFKLASDRDLVTEFEIDTLTAIVGTSLKVNLPNGEALVVKVPALLKQGQMLRLAGKGIPCKPNPGSVFLIANLVPPTGLTDEQIAAIVSLHTPKPLEI